MASTNDTQPGNNAGETGCQAAPPAAAAGDGDKRPAPEPEVSGATNQPKNDPERSDPGISDEDREAAERLEAIPDRHDRYALTPNARRAFANARQDAGDDHTLTQAECYQVHDDDLEKHGYIG